MARTGWIVAASIGVAMGALAMRNTAPPGTLQVERLELVDAEGNVVGRLATTASGAELVLGGQAQASLVTDGSLAAVNLVGQAATARLLAGEEPHLVRLPPPSERCVPSL